MFTAPTYTGIGSRRTTEEKLTVMADTAKFLDYDGYTLYSGGAPGPDDVFENCSTNKLIFLPWNNFNKKPMLYKIPQDAYYIAESFHPGWFHLKDTHKHLMARNVMEILGKDLKTPTWFVICSTPDGCKSEAQRTNKTGGTGQAISVADYFGIPIFNLSVDSDLQAVMEYTPLLKIKHPSELANVYIDLDLPKLTNSFYSRRKIFTPHKDTVYVFGSNMAGIHGAGAALIAKQKFGAKTGHWTGMTGNAYAIPTKDQRLQQLSLSVINDAIQQFVKYTQTSGKTFYLTGVGTGLAGIHPDIIAPMFKGIVNTWIPETWKKYFDNSESLIKRTANPKVLNKYKLEPGQTGKLIDRTTAWGNLFTEGTRDERCDNFEKWLRTQPELIAQAKKHLKGYNLICSCAPHRCHGDTWIRIVNE